MPTRPDPTRTDYRPPGSDIVLRGPWRQLVVAIAGKKKLRFLWMKGAVGMRYGLFPRAFSGQTQVLIATDFFLFKLFVFFLLILYSHSIWKCWLWHIKYGCFLYDTVEIITCYSMSLLRWRAQLSKAYHNVFFCSEAIVWFLLITIYNVEGD